MKIYKENNQLVIDGQNSSIYTFYDCKDGIVNVDKSVFEYNLNLKGFHFINGSYNSTFKSKIINTLKILKIIWK